MYFHTERATRSKDRRFGVYFQWLGFQPYLETRLLTLEASTLIAGGYNMICVN